MMGELDGAVGDAEEGVGLMTIELVVRSRTGMVEVTGFAVDSTRLSVCELVGVIGTEDGSLDGTGAFGERVESSQAVIHPL